MKIRKIITMIKTNKLVLASILIGMTVFFSACKKNPVDPGNTSDTDPRDGSTWILYDMTYTYHADHGIDLISDPASPLYGEPYLGQFNDTVGIFKWIAKDTMLDGEKWLAIYSSNLVAYPDFFGNSRLMFCLQKRSDGWWVKKGDDPNLGEEGLWLPLDDQPGQHSGCVNIFEGPSFYPDNHKTVTVSHAKYGYASNVPDEHRYLIHYKDPDDVNGNDIISDRFFTKYSSTGQLLKNYVFEEYEATVAAPNDRYYVNTYINIGSFTR